MRPLRKLRNLLGRGKSQPITSSIDPDIMLGDNEIVATRQGLRWLLYKDRYLDQEILKWGFFERETTEIFLNLIKPHMIVFDVGANFGYYTALTAARLNREGHVHAFEPTLNYRQRLLGNLVANRLESRVTVHPFALSNIEGEADIRIGNSSATMHPVGEYGSTEKITLKKLDDFVVEQKIDRIDMIKVDIDGHEPLFIEGGLNAISRFRPCLLLEISEQHLAQHDSSAVRQRIQLEDMGYVLFSEKTGKRFVSASEFLSDCGDPLVSSNVWCFAEENAPESLF